MERVYGSGELEYTSEPFCLREFFKDGSLHHHPFLHDTNLVDSHLSKKRRVVAHREKMMDMMDIKLTDSEFADLENICSESHFKIPGVSLPPVIDPHEFLQPFLRSKIPADSQLVTHHKIKSRARVHERLLKYTSVVWMNNNHVPDNKKKKPDSHLSPGKELVAVVRLYAPFRHIAGKRCHRIAVDCQEIIILGSQTLADLRDKFSCASDKVVNQDLSSNPFSKVKSQAKDKYKSGMMYLGDTFYDDMRQESNIEYSETVLKWAKQKCIQLGKKGKMEDTKIIDLIVKLGYPYLYQHQGNCEHLFTFSDIRLIHQSDPLLLSKYPVIKSVSKQQSRYCMLCGHYVAKWVTVGNTRVPHDPCYFCQACFISYNYINKNKIKDFAAYSFSDSSHEFVGVESNS